MGIHYNSSDLDLLTYVTNKEDFRVENGFIQRTDQPGLGVTLDEDIIREMSRVGHAWKNPLWRNRDGSFSEW